MQQVQMKIYKEMKCMFITLNARFDQLTNHQVFVQVESSNT